MPYVIDENGNKKYVPSVFAKEELPTWDEFYNEFYKERAYFYSHVDREHLKRDPYWKIPHRKYLLGVVCNQLNKMIFEDGMKDRLTAYVSTILQFPITYVSFVLEDGKNYPPFVANDEKVPQIYTIPLPTGQPNPFIIPSDIERIDLAAMKGYDLFLIPKLGYDIGKVQNQKLPHLHYDHMDKIIDFMMKDVKKYFEGDGVGWKDENGNLIDQDPTKPMNDSGVDPAL